MVRIDEDDRYIRSLLTSTRYHANIQLRQFYLIEPCVDAENLIPSTDDVTLLLSSTKYHPKIQLHRFYLMDHCVDAEKDILSTVVFNLPFSLFGYIEISGMREMRFTRCFFWPKAVISGLRPLR